ncbi:MAG: GNAT family N-acetyltransferase [Christensenellales bacterium]
MNIIRLYNMVIYKIKKADFIPIEAKIDLEYREINNENINEVMGIRGKHFLNEFKKVLKGNKALGIAAYKDEEVIGYGWLKTKGARDSFFNLENVEGYLATFFVKREAYRGKKIYPSLITKLIESEKAKEVKEFYIATERKNTSSQKGFLKLNAKHEKNIKILRAMKITLNKYTL